MANSIPRSGPQRKRKGVVSSSVVAAATAGVTGITLAWAIGTSPTPDGSAGAAAKVSSQIAADRAAMTQLQQSIADTRRQLSALGGVNIPASTKDGKPVAPGPPGTAAVAGAPGTTGTLNSSGGGATSGAVAYSGTSGTTGSNAGSAGATSGIPAGASSSGSTGAISGGSSGGGPAPSPTPAPTPSPTSPPATSPPPTKPPPPPVTTTTRASAA